MEQRGTGALSANVCFVPATVVGPAMRAGGTIHGRLMQMGSSVGFPTVGGEDGPNPLGVQEVRKPPDP